MDLSTKDIKPVEPTKLDITPNSYISLNDDTIVVPIVWNGFLNKFYCAAEDIKNLGTLFDRQIDWLCQMLEAYSRVVSSTHGKDANDWKKQSREEAFPHIKEPDREQIAREAGFIR